MAFALSASAVPARRFPPASPSGTRTTRASRARVSATPARRVPRVAVPRFTPDANRAARTRVQTAAGTPRPALHSPIALPGGTPPPPFADARRRSFSRAPGIAIPEPSLSTHPPRSLAPRPTPRLTVPSFPLLTQTPPLFQPTATPVPSTWSPSATCAWTCSSPRRPSRAPRRSRRRRRSRPSRTRIPPNLRGRLAATATSSSPPRASAYANCVGHVATTSTATSSSASSPTRACRFAASPPRSLSATRVATCPRRHLFRPHGRRRRPRLLQPVRSRSLAAPRGRSRGGRRRRQIARSRQRRLRQRVRLRRDASRRRGFRRGDRKGERRHLLRPGPARVHVRARSRASRGAGHDPRRGGRGARDARGSGGAGGFGRVARAASTPRAMTPLAGESRIAVPRPVHVAARLPRDRGARAVGGDKCGPDGASIFGARDAAIRCTSARRGWTWATPSGAATRRRRRLSSGVRRSPPRGKNCSTLSSGKIAYLPNTVLAALMEETLTLATAVGAATATRAGAGRNVATVDAVEKLLEGCEAAGGGVRRVRYQPGRGETREGHARREPEKWRKALTWKGKERRGERREGGGETRGVSTRCLIDGRGKGRRDGGRDGREGGGTRGVSTRCLIRR